MVVFGFEQGATQVYQLVLSSSACIVSSLVSLSQLFKTVLKRLRKSQGASSPRVPSIAPPPPVLWQEDSSLINLALLTDTVHMKILLVCETKMEFTRIFLCVKFL